MIWLAVDSDGTEHIFVRPVVRYRHSCEENQRLSLSIADINNPADIWVEITSEEKVTLPRIELPSGTIKKIIGKSLTWDDDAVSLE